MLQFFKDVKNMHWAPRLILILVVAKVLVAMYREQAIFLNNNPLNNNEAPCLLYFFYSPFLF